MDQKVILDLEESDIIKFQANRIVTNFMKSMLVMIEDLAEDHDIALCKLQENLPNEYKKYVNLADYFTEDKFRNLRGKILTNGNNAIREIEENLKNFDIKIKGNK